MHSFFHEDFHQTTVDSYPISHQVYTEFCIPISFESDKIGIDVIQSANIHVELYICTNN